ncbi:MAG: MaoC family dehydratase N-terminal domain-containing protein, partial [Cutibacterium granulosum]|nr:MaoC family dehydratase N-terminal domain-containing protein [Cutibacterium granulosum]
MPISKDHVGRTYPTTDPYHVSAAKITEFATAIRDDSPAYQGPDPVAPPTFAMVIAAHAWQRLFDDPDLGLRLD